MRCSSTTRGIWIIGKCKSISPTFGIFWYFAFSNIYSSILLTKFVLHTLGYAFDFLRYSEKLRKESNEIGNTLQLFVIKLSVIIMKSNILPWNENFNFILSGKNFICIPSHEWSMASLKYFNSSCFVVVVIEWMDLVLFEVSFHFIVNCCWKKDGKHS